MTVSEPEGGRRCEARIENLRECCDREGEILLDVDRFLRSSEEEEFADRGEQNAEDRRDLTLKFRFLLGG